MPKGTVTAIDFDALTEGPDIASLPSSGKAITANANAAKLLERVIAARANDKALTDNKRYATSEDARTVGLRYQRMLERGLRNDKAHDEDGARLTVVSDGTGFVWNITIGKRIVRKRKNRDDSTTPKTPDPTYADGNGRRERAAK